MYADSLGEAQFQFTPLREGRRNLARSITADIISIHAPPRGATASRTATYAFRAFQFTPLREGRPETHRPTPQGGHFNSRPSARGDNLLTLTKMFDKISIHAPPRGATSGCWISRCKEPISIHAPPRGATSAPRSHATPPTNFNSRPSARGDALVERCI